MGSMTRFIRPEAASMVRAREAIRARGGKGRVICGQALTKDVDDAEYSPDMKLSEV